jgi:hypothetical protein
MVVSKLVLECPFCSEIVEVTPPDKAHSMYSSKKIVANSHNNNIVEKKHKCQNPACKKLIKLYWYAPLAYFNRI